MRLVISLFDSKPLTSRRTLELGPFAGLIYTVILIVGCLFFLVLEWTMPRESLDYVQMHWDQERFAEVGCMPDADYLEGISQRDIVFGADCREGEERTAPGFRRRS